MKPVVAIIGCLLLLCCCFTVFAGFAAIGYLQNGTSCVYKGPFSQVSSGPCANVNPTIGGTSMNTSTNTTTPTSPAQYDGEYSDQFTFTYDSSTMSVSDSLSDGLPEVKIFLNNENSINGNDNENIIQSSDTFTPSAGECQSLGSDADSQLIQSGYTIVDGSFQSQVIEMNGTQACNISWQATSDSQTIDQTQYYIPDTTNSVTYIITITVSDGSSNFGALNSVAQSLEIK